MKNQESLKILIVEDDRDIRDLLNFQLSHDGHNTVCASDGQEALDYIDKEDFDLFILDRMLPSVTGIEICQYLRKHKNFSEHPILMVTALTTPAMVIEGLEAGADDYINKPFDLNVLIARINCLTRRVKRLNINDDDQLIEFGPFKINSGSHRFYLRGDEVSLTKSEFDLMNTLLANLGRVQSRESLVSVVQGGDVHVTERTIDTHIFGLRKKLKSDAIQVQSVRGIGYRINDQIQKN